MEEEDDDVVFVVANENKSNKETVSNDHKKNLRQFFSPAVKRKTRSLLGKALALRKKEEAIRTPIVLDDDEDFEDFKQENVGGMTVKPNTRLKTKSMNHATRRRKPKSEKDKKDAPTAISKSDVISKSSGMGTALKDKEQKNNDGVECKDDAKSLSRSETGATKCCHICNREMLPSMMSNHLVQCMKTKFGCQKKNSVHDSVPVEKIDCPVCGKDLVLFGLQARTLHINGCIDKDSDRKEDEGKHNQLLQNARTSIMPCPMCGKKVQTVESRTRHLKQCSLTNKMSVEQVRHLINQQTEEYNNMLDAGVLPQDFRPPATKQAKGKKEALSVDEDVQLAVALSTSMMEFQTPNTAVEKTVVLKQATAKPKAGKKSKQGETTSLLLSLNKEEANERVSKNVAAVVFNGSAEDDNLSKTPSFKKVKKWIVDDIESLWSKSSLAGPSDIPPVTSTSSVEISSSSSSSSSAPLSTLLSSSSLPFYVTALMPAVSVSKVVPGSKLRRCSLIPGRGKSFGPTNIGQDGDNKDVCGNNENSKDTVVTVQPAATPESSSIPPASPLSPTTPTTSDVSILSTQRSHSQTVAILAQLAEENEMDSVSEVTLSETTENQNDEVGNTMARTPPNCLRDKPVTGDEGKDRVILDSLSSDLLSIVDNPAYSDVTFKVQGGEDPIAAHMNILHARCPQICREIEAHLEDGEEGRVLDLSSFSRDSVLSILYFIYGGKVIRPALGDWTEVVHLAKRFSLDSLLSVVKRLECRQLTCVGVSEETEERSHCGHRVDSESQREGAEIEDGGGFGCDSGQPNRDGCDQDLDVSVKRDDDMGRKISIDSSKDFEVEKRTLEEGEEREDVDDDDEGSHNRKDDDDESVDKRDENIVDKESEEERWDERDQDNVLDEIGEDSCDLENEEGSSDRKENELSAIPDLMEKERDSALLDLDLSLELDKDGGEDVDGVFVSNDSVDDLLESVNVSVCEQGADGIDDDKKDEGREDEREEDGDDDGDVVDVSMVIEKANKGVDDDDDDHSDLIGGVTNAERGCEINDVLGNETRDIMGCEINDVLGNETRDIMGCKINDVLGNETRDIMGCDINDFVGSKTSDIAGCETNDGCRSGKVGCSNELLDVERFDNSRGENSGNNDNEMHDSNEKDLASDRHLQSEQGEDMHENVTGDLGGEIVTHDFGEENSMFKRPELNKSLADPSHTSKDLQPQQSHQKRKWVTQKEMKDIISKILQTGCVDDEDVDRIKVKVEQLDHCGGQQDMNDSVFYPSILFDGMGLDPEEVCVTYERIAEKCYKKRKRASTTQTSTASVKRQKLDQSIYLTSVVVNAPSLNNDGDEAIHNSSHLDHDEQREKASTVSSTMTPLTKQLGESVYLRKPSSSNNHELHADSSISKLYSGNQSKPRSYDAVSDDKCSHLNVSATKSCENREMSKNDISKRQNSSSSRSIQESAKSLGPQTDSDSLLYDSDQDLFVSDDENGVENNNSCNLTTRTPEDEKSKHEQVSTVKKSQFYKSIQIVPNVETDEELEPSTLSQVAKEQVKKQLVKAIFSIFSNRSQSLEIDNEKTLSNSLNSTSNRNLPHKDSVLKSPLMIENRDLEKVYPESTPNNVRSISKGILQANNLSGQDERISKSVLSKRHETRINIRDCLQGQNRRQLESIISHGSDSSIIVTTNDLVGNNPSARTNLNSGGCSTPTSIEAFTEGMISFVDKHRTVDTTLQSKSHSPKHISSPSKCSSETARYAWSYEPHLCSTMTSSTCKTSSTSLKSLTSSKSSLKSATPNPSIVGQRSKDASLRKSSSIPQKNEDPDLLHSSPVCQMSRCQQNNPEEVRTLPSLSPLLPLRQRLGLADPFKAKTTEEQQAAVTSTPADQDMGRSSKSPSPTEQKISEHETSVGIEDLDDLDFESIDNLMAVNENTPDCSDTLGTPCRYPKQTISSPLKSTMAFRKDKLFPNLKLANEKTPECSRTAKGGNSGKVPSPFTPMPAYNEMNTPDLKKAVQKIGVKPLGKKRMRDLLTHVYLETHQYETDSDYEGTPVKHNRHQEIQKKSYTKNVLELGSGREGSSNSCSEFSSTNDRGKNKTVKDKDRIPSVGEEDGNDDDNDDGDDDLSNSQEACHNDDRPGALEESILQHWPEEDDMEPPCTQLTQTSMEVLSDRLMTFLWENPKIYERILMYEALELDVLKKQISDAGIRIGLARLQDFLDERCITFSMKNMSNRNNRYQAPRKAGTKKNSPVKRKQVSKSSKQT